MATGGREGQGVARWPWLNQGCLFLTLTMGTSGVFLPTLQGRAVGRQNVGGKKYFCQKRKQGCQRYRGIGEISGALKAPTNKTQIQHWMGRSEV